MRNLATDRRLTGYNQSINIQTATLRKRGESISLTLPHCQFGVAVMIVSLRQTLVDCPPAQMDINCDVGEVPKMEDGKIAFNKFR